MSVVEIIGSNPVFRAEVKKLSRTATCDASVLIIGETGTGKEVFAKTIHNLGKRGSKPFIPVNCGAIPVDLVENELFGHERGAYTGASITHVGLIGEATGGTLFLDEIDSLPLMAQVKLLRFLQEREYRPLGSVKTLRADVRIISASSVDLRKAVAEGQLRQDLFFRLNVVTVNIPPLRDRREDIIPFAEHFLRSYASKFDKPATEFSQGALIKLMSYNWPGNVREMENTIERAVVLSDHAVIAEDEIVLSGSEAPVVYEPFQKAKARAVDQFERNYIRALLTAHSGNITHAADTAKKDRRAFVHLIRKHKIAVQQFKATANARGSHELRDAV